MVIYEAPTLANPDYSSPFIIFYFASKTTLVVVLLQKNTNGDDQPIAFFSIVMRDAELRYDIIEKKAYALTQALKAFITYFMHSQITSYVPTHGVKIVLTHPDIDGRRGRWIAKLLEFELEIKTTKLIKGQGLAKLLAESNCKVLGINMVSEISSRENP